MFYQHYLGIKKPTFLACNTEQVHAAILESSKISDLFQNRQTYSHLIFETSRDFLRFCKTAYVMRESVV